MEFVMELGIEFGSLVMTMELYLVFEYSFSILFDNDVSFGCTTDQMFCFRGWSFWLEFKLAFELGVLDGASL